MRRSNTFVIMIWGLLLLICSTTNAQTLQVALSPDRSKVDRNAKDGMATILFESNVEDLSIVCTEEKPEEPIVKVTNNLWYTHIIVKKDIVSDGICYRNFILRSPASAEYFLTTEPISSKQVLYYTIALPNELEPKLQEEKAKNIAKIANTLTEEGDIFLAMTLLMEVCDTMHAVVPEVEDAMRKALDCYNTPGYKCVGVLPHKGMVFGGDYSRDGTTIVTGSEDGYVRFWNAQNGEYLRSLPRQNGFIYNVEYYKSNDQILFSTDSYSILWNLNNETFRQLRGGNASFEMNDNFVFTRDENNFRLWDTKSGACKRTIPRKGFSVGTYTPDGTFLYLATASSAFFLTRDSAYIVQYNAENMREISRFFGHTGTIHNINALENNSLITGAYDGKVKFWDRQTNITKTINLKANVYDISKDSKTERIGISTDKYDAWIWNLNTNSLDTLKGHSQCVQALRFSPLNNDVVTMSNDKTARIWHKTDSLPDIVIAKDGFSCYGCSSDGNLMAFGSYDDYLYFYDVSTNLLLCQESPFPDVRSIRFSEDKTHIIATCGDMAPQSCTFIYDIQKNVSQDSTFNNMDVFQNLHFSSDFDINGRYAYSIIGSSLTLWKLDNWKLSTCLLEDWDRVIPSAAFSESAVYFAYSYRDNDWHGVHILNLLTMESFDVQSNSSRDIGKIRFIGDDELLLVSNNGIELLNLQTKEVTKNYSYQSVSFGDVYYLPDSKQIVGLPNLASDNSDIVVWDKESGKQAYSIRNRVIVEESSLNDRTLYLFGFGDGILSKLEIEYFPSIYRRVKGIIGNRVLSTEEKQKYNLD